uniref:Uncharacterized protein n=1 Tax=Pinguiococcus pyrenoidosus TaxID=172671 RepID=A0A7R9YEY8_9STRA|mmetsp:Transcript_6974/g.26857  ORF Transcript_6974/g.26857 Transcript_6974/m.26857 type:complete len:201 (+) Transcript_6974:110-712(+)
MIFQLLADAISLSCLGPLYRLVRTENPLWIFGAILLDALDGWVARRQVNPDPLLSRVGEILDSSMDFLSAVAFCYAVRRLATAVPLAIFCCGSILRLVGFVAYPAYFSGVLVDPVDKTKKVVYYGLSVPLALGTLALLAKSCAAQDLDAGGKAKKGRELPPRNGAFPAPLDVPLLILTGLLFWRVLIFHKWWIKPPALPP